MPFSLYCCWADSSPVNALLYDCPGCPAIITPLPQYCGKSPLNPGNSWNVSSLPAPLSAFASGGGWVSTSMVVVSIRAAAVVGESVAGGGWDIVVNGIAIFDGPGLDGGGGGGGGAFVGAGGGAIALVVVAGCGNGRGGKKAGPENFVNGATMKLNRANPGGFPFFGGNVSCLAWATGRGGRAVVGGGGARVVATRNGFGTGFGWRLYPRASANCNSRK